jgi:glyoxylase-like metal-dependent hydrolase (beta-lactamase superfamily II)
MPSITRGCLVTLTTIGAVAGCGPAKPAASSLDTGAADRWCTHVPRAANQAFERVAVSSQWFEVYRVEPGVFALVEANQFQEAVSYLIVGSDRALLFDTGLGLAPIRPVVEELTPLPIQVLNSHTHYDHVGGNAEFEQVLAVDTPYTTANQAGFQHTELAGEVAAESFCHGAPARLDTAGFKTKAWRAAQIVADGDTIDLGGRRLEIIQMPGHTPDAVALLDRANGLLWTGDSYYDATIWLYVPETDLDSYEQSLEKLVALAPALKRLLPAHNTISADPAHLRLAREAIRSVRSGAVKGTEESGNRLVFGFGDFSILTSKPLLEGKNGDRTRGGSGLTTWP